MKASISISKATIDRLPLYYRALRLAGEEGLEIVSSDELGKRLDITPEQIRKDLASFGQFGKKGVGYYVGGLKKKVGEILGLDNHWNIAVVGIGHLGAALANYQNFISLGFNLVSLIDQSPSVIGTKIANLTVEDSRDLEKIIAAKNVHIGVITVPAPFAQSVADRLVAAGVKGIWNFAPVKIAVPPNMHLVNEDLSVGLSSLSYHITRDV